jgi:hypothetical protein
VHGTFSNALQSFIGAAAAVAGVAVACQLQDPTSTLRLKLAELADRLREVTP